MSYWQQVLMPSILGSPGVGPPGSRVSGTFPLTGHPIARVPRKEGVVSSLKRTAGAVLLCAVALSSAAVVDIEEQALSAGLSKASPERICLLVEEAARGMAPGDVLLLPRSLPVGDVDLSAAPENCTIEFGQGGNLYLGARTVRNMRFNNVDARILAQDRPLEGAPLSKSAAALGTFEACEFFKVSQISNANYLNSAFLGVEGVNGQRVIDIDGGQFDNCAALYVWYHNLNNTGPYLYMDLNGGGQGSRIYQIVEHNYCETQSSVVIKRANGLTMGVGDTESSAAAAGVWSIQGCTNMLLVAHRDFKSHSRDCWGLGYMVTGGSGNKFYYAYNIGDPQEYSLRVLNSSNFELWGFFGEDKCDVPSDALKCFFTAEGMKYEPKAWSEPMMVENEVIWDYDGYTINGTQDGASATPDGYTVPAPPDVPKLDMPPSTGKYSSTLSKRPANWGSALLDLGADPTGTKSSSDAIERLLKTRISAEIPAGTFLLTRPIDLTAIQSERIVGAGTHETVLKATGDFPIFVAKSSTASKTLGGAAAEGCSPIQDVITLTLDGGNYGAYVDGYWPGRCWINLHFQNQTTAAIYQPAGNEYDQQQYYHCSFTNTGRWGVRIENGMTDKQCFFDCSFSGQTDAGISFPNTHMFAGSIAQCTFTDIDGPGVEIGWNKEGGAAGYTPHQSMIMQCTFTECGSETRPAIDWSWMESAMIAHSRVEIRNKPWKYGILGTGQIFHACTVDVNVDNMVTDGAAFAVRSTRQAKNARPIGNVLKHCWSNGPIKFVLDAESPVKINASSDGYNHTGLKWWQSFDNYPWQYPHLLYDCTFSNNSYDYTLLRVDPNGNVLTEVDFTTGEVHHVLPQAASLTSGTPRIWRVCDIQGRQLGLIRSATRPSPKAMGLATGMYLIRPTQMLPGDRSTKLISWR